MSQPPILGAVTTLSVAEPSGCDLAALSRIAGLVRQVRGWLDAVEASVASRAAELSAPEVVAHGRASREVRTVVARGALCSALPVVQAALASGTVAAGQVDAIARVAARLEEPARAELLDQAPALVEAAAGSTVDGFERHVRDLGRRLEGDGLAAAEKLRGQRSLRRWTDRESGMCHTHLVLDPEADARVSAVLDAAVAAERSKPDTGRTFEQLRADAFVAVITSRAGVGRRHAQVSVLVDHATLLGGLHARSVCETSDGQPLSPEAVRRLACDADLIPIVLDGAGAILDHGRSRRVASAAQRNALRAMYRTCAHPTCTVRFGDCEIHHVIEWIDHHGPTDLANLLPLCSEHHHQIHDAGWHLTLRPDRTLTLRRPDGTVSFHGTTVDAQPSAA